MNFPLDEFRSEHSGPETKGRPGSETRTARHGGKGLTRVPPALPTLSKPAASGMVGYSRTLIGWTIWRERLPFRAGQTSRGRLTVIATAALTSATVTLLTIWLWGPDQASRRGRVDSEAVGTVTVTYERLDESLSEPFPLAESPAPPEVLEQTEASPSREARVLPAPVLPAAAPPPVRKASRARGVATPVPTTKAGGQSARANAKAGLVVITQPRGARVTINGVGYGTTPLTIPHLAPGPKRIRVTKAGYESAERFVDADTGQAAVTLRINLEEVDAERPPG